MGDRIKHSVERMRGFLADMSEKSAAELVAESRDMDEE